MNKYIIFWNNDEHKKLLTWWASLNQNRGWRAELRHMENPEGVLLTQGFRFLFYELAGYWTKDENLFGLAAVAGIVAHIEINDDKSFAESCAYSEEGRDKPIISELRFSQLQKSRTLDELFIRMIRTIKILKRRANIISVTDSVLHWYKEMVKGEVETESRNHILVRWGLDYFQHLPKITNK